LARPPRTAAKGGRLADYYKNNLIPIVKKGRLFFLCVV